MLRHSKPALRHQHTQDGLQQVRICKGRSYLLGCQYICASPVNLKDLTTRYSASSQSFEQHLPLLPNTWLVVRLDGHSFHRFTAEHKFAKPNDARALKLMNYAAERCMNELQDIVLAYGQSDEYSFVFRRSTNLYKRREAKITSTLCSLFTANYVFSWSKFFPGMALKYPPSFDGRAVCYPTDQNLRDYLSWRQADCHINNLVCDTDWLHAGTMRIEE